MSWIDIGDIEDIPLRGARLVKTHIGCIAVFRTAEARSSPPPTAAPTKAVRCPKGSCTGNR